MRSLLKNCRRLPQSDTGQTIIGKRTTLWNNSIFANAPKESLSNVTPSTPRRLPRRSQKPNTPSSPQLHLTFSNPGSRALIIQQTCRGLLSAVSKPIFAKTIETTHPTALVKICTICTLMQRVFVAGQCCFEHCFRVFTFRAVSIAKNAEHVSLNFGKISLHSVELNFSDVCNIVLNSR